MSPTDLPLREPDRHATDREREDEIAELVQRFYERGRADGLIGPVFESRVRDWDAHLATMRDFWVSVIYRAGRYSGRPLEAHRAIAGLNASHFARWLELWEATVAETARPEVRPALVDFARRMAATMAARLGVAG